MRFRPRCSKKTVIFGGAALWGLLPGKKAGFGLTRLAGLYATTFEANLFGFAVSEPHLISIPQ